MGTETRIPYAIFVVFSPAEGLSREILEGRKVGGISWVMPIRLLSYLFFVDAILLLEKMRLE